jgi:hypothetical protein
LPKTLYDYLKLTSKNKKRESILDEALELKKNQPEYHSFLLVSLQKILFLKFYIERLSDSSLLEPFEGYSSVLKEIYIRLKLVEENLNFLVDSLQEG